MAIRWGIVGCGDVAEVKSGPGFQLCRDSSLTAVMRRNGDLARDFAERHGVPHWGDDADLLINNPEVDAVYIATPPGSHLEYALKVAAAGKPAYVEKPMARSHAECARMIAAFQAVDLPLYVAFYRRALDRFLKVKEIVAAGTLGRVTGVSYRFTGTPAVPAPQSQTEPGSQMDEQALPWRLQAVESGGGLFMDLGCHTLDIIDFMLGPLCDVHGTAANCDGRYSVEDTVAMSFTLDSGAPGVAQWNFAGSLREDLIEISGPRGRVSLSTFANEPVRLQLAGREELFDLPNPKHIQTPMIQSIVDDLMKRGTCSSTGATAARTASVMDKVLESYYGSRDDEFWSRPESWPGRPRTGRVNA